MSKLIISILFLLNLNLSANDVDKGVAEFKKGNKKEANQFYKKACKNENMLGCIKSGILYLTGDGIKQNHKKAKKLFRRACQKRHVTACYYLGSMYKHGGDGVKRNFLKAKNFFAYGCKRGHEPSCNQYNAIKDKPNFIGNGKNIINSGYTYSPQIYGG